MGKKFSKKGKKFLLHRVLPAGLILTACTAGAYVVTSAQYTSRFLPGTTIAGIDVSERTLGEAVDAIRKEEEKYTLTIRFRGGAEEVLTADDMNLQYDCEHEVKTLLNEQNTYSWLSRELGDESAHALESGYTYGEKKLKSSIAALPELQEGYYVEPENASLALEPGLVFDVVPENEGDEIREDVLVEKAGAAIKAGDRVLDLTSLDEVYEQPAVRTDDAELAERRDALNKVLEADVSIKLSDGSMIEVDKKTTVGWITVDENGLYTVDENAVAESAKRVMARAAKVDDNYGYYRPFASTNYGMQKFDSENLHGHTLDQEKMADTLATMVLKGRSGVINPQYLQYEDSLDPHFGGTYAEVDIYAQHVYYYRDYQLVYDCDCVTGTAGYSGTPSGIYSIEEKIRGRELNGYREDGTLSYSVYVQYWMCFLPHYGFHDASWRDSFGGSIYEYDGSHGCINLPTYAAADLYELMDYGTPVIIFRGQVEEEDDAIEQSDEADESVQPEEAYAEDAEPSGAGTEAETYSTVEPEEYVEEGEEI